MKSLIVIFIGMFALAGSAHASFYNFAVSSANEAGYAVYTDGDLTVTAGSAVGLSDYFAYLDGPSGATNTGGLGVCQQPLGNCAFISDDNHQKDDEFVRMVLGTERGFVGLTVQGNHDAVAQGTFLQYMLDGVMQTAIDISGKTLEFVALAANSASRLDYWITNTTGPAEIYVTSLTTVPVPAAIWLFGTALLGFISLSRRVRV